jgi:meiotically up-regulated gene 157 (Mug157) protein
MNIDSIRDVADQLHSADPHLNAMFRNALLNSSTQASFESDGTTYIRTGDIPAMWLRDSSAQMRPFLFFAKADREAADMLRRVIARQAKCLILNPYANAFRADYSIWENKFELDSLAYPQILAWQYWKQTGDTSIFTNEFALSMDSVFKTMLLEQDHLNQSAYRFDGLANNGLGNHCAQTGMIWSGFRPSDDECKYPFNIPDQMMATVALAAMEEITTSIYNDRERAKGLTLLREQVQAGIQKYGIVDHPEFGKIYAYEVDGEGNFHLMDDPNIPSLLSAPYLGYLSAEDLIYRNTRRFVLSDSNPNFSRGEVVTGIGSEHTKHLSLALGGTPESPAFYDENVHDVWPLGIVMQGLTADSVQEKQAMLAFALATDPGDGRLHESLNPNDKMQYTRPDFGWPNALFAEFIMLDFLKVPALPLPQFQA